MMNFQPTLDAAEAAAPAWLQDRLAAGRAQWAISQLPTRKTEAWKYTSLHSLEQDFAVAAPAPDDIAAADLDYPALGPTQLVFVDGRLREDLSSRSLPAGVQLIHFAAADAHQAQIIGEHLGRALPVQPHLFAALNDATLADGVFLQVQDDVVARDSIHLLWLSSEQATACSVNQRLLVVMGRHSQATVIEHFAGAGHSNTFTNGMTELLLDVDARLHHYRLQLEAPDARHIGGVYARLADASTLNSFHLALGSTLKRLDIVVDHQGPGAHCQINGIYLPRGTEHIDYHTCIEHASPHGSSEQTFRGIIGDRASAVFNGRIHIHPQAQKTRATLSNKNLLTSAGAEVNSKPELEIYADDVQCAHGATVAQLDRNMLHYLRTRGIARAEADVMLSYGFINELVAAVELIDLREYIKPLLAHHFCRDPRLTQHLT